MMTRPGPGNSATIVGCGRSGVAATRLLVSHGVHVTVVDDATRAQVGAAADAVEHLGVTCHFSASPEAALPPADFLVVSPGVPTHAPRFDQAVAAGMTLVGEIALASWFCPAPMLVVTGTNGKTTTATLLHHVLHTAGLSPVLAGNVGTAFSGVVADVTADQIMVLEASSYQLEHAPGFRPSVGAILNVTPDHLDRYATFEAYVVAKRGLWDMLADDGLAVANADDSTVAREAASYGGRLARFGLAAHVDLTATVEQGQVVLRRAGTQSDVMPVADIPLLGAHNVSNVLAALACTVDVCDNLAGLAAGIRTFTPVPHRLEPVREVRGVQYINDSKATNVSATCTALAAMDRRTVLLLGGRGKGSGYTALRPLVEQQTRLVVVYGEDAARILADLGRNASTAQADTFEGAVETAAAAAVSGDAVLLSPACASFDMFRNFEARGDAFRALVEAL